MAGDGIGDWLKRLFGGGAPGQGASRPAPTGGGIGGAVGQHRPPPRVPFPYPVTIVHGSAALATWQRIRDAGEGWPVVLGEEANIGLIEESFGYEPRSPEAILAAARDLDWPAWLEERRARDDAQAIAYLESQNIPVEREDAPPEIGEWPPEDEVVAGGFALDTGLMTRRPIERVAIATLPCRDSWEAMAYLKWGGWNANPDAEYHVAAIRSWHERYGAELVGVLRDVVQIRVATRPATRDEALALAREHYLYCNDTVDQGTGALAPLAAELMASDWWYFWWD